jgi:hypothetical protein
MNKALACLLLLALAAFGQQDRGTFTGTLTDQTGAVVPNAKITISNIETNARYETVSNDVGQYRVPNLPIGNYRLTFEAQGFKNTVREGVTLNIAQVARIDAVMQVGSAAESVQVTAEAPLLNTETPEVGTVLNNRTVVDLPLGFGGGRYAENFAYRLTPGVAGNNWESRINGSPAFAKQVVLDGADATIYIGGHLGESSPSMEALEEFKVQTSGMSAEFGRTAGGVFNFVMKSGTNQFHGSALGQIHNEWMDANTFANNFYGRPKRLDRRHNWAVSGGAPIWIPKIYNGRDRTFFYTAFERYKEAYGGGGSPTVTLPLPEMWNGDFGRLLTNEVIGKDALGRDILRGAIYDPRTTRMVDGKMVRDPFPGNIIPSNLISGPARALAGIFSQHYTPTVRDASGQIALLNNAFFPVSNQAGFSQNQFSTKVDHHISTSHKLSGSFVYVDRPRNLLDQGGVWDFNDPLGGPLSRVRIQHVRSWYGRASYDWTLTPTLLNHLQLGFNRQRNPSTSRHIGENGVAALGLQGYSGTYNWPEIIWDGNDRVNFPRIGYQANDFGAGQNFQGINTVSWIKDRHSMRIGVDFRRSYLRWRSNPGPGQLTFNRAVTGLEGFNQTGFSMASLLLGEVNQSSVPINTPTGSRYTNLALFFQDDFKVTSRLTLNLGLRWDYQPLPTEHYNRVYQFNPNLMDTRWGFPGALEFGNEDKRYFGKNSYNDFGPRLGLAWQIFNKTALRAGYGVFYHGRNANGWSGVPWGSTIGYQSINQVNAPNAYTAAFNWSNPYPGVTRPISPDPSLSTPPTNAWGPVSWDPDAGRVGNTQQWNFNIQQELPWQIVFDIGYVGSKSTGTQANELRQINQLDPKFLALGEDLNVWVTNDAQLPASVRAAGGRYPYGNLGESIPSWQTLTPFPHLIYWNQVYSAFSPLGFGTYNALQVQLNKRYSHGVQWLANYTWSKTIDNLNSAFGDTWGQNTGRPMDYYNLSLDKSVSAFDRTHWIKVGATLDLPVGRGRTFGNNMNRALDFAVGGWTIQYIGNYSSGEPLGFSGTQTAVGNFTTQRAMLVNPEGKPLKIDWDSKNFDMSRISTAGTAAHQYLDTSLIRNPGRFERGNTAYRYSQLRSPWFLSDDFSLQKNFQPTESMRIQFRAEALNMFNRHRFTGINTNASSPLFGQVTGVSDDRRQIQFGIRADW